MKAKTPFFARFLENQKVRTGIQAGANNVTMKYPSDDDEYVTMKYPSDDDEAVIS